MLRRRREQRTYVGKELLVLQVPILFRRTTPTRTRKSHRRTNQRLRRQPLLRRRRRRELAMCALVRITLLQSVRTAKATTPPTWLLARLEEHRGTVIYYLLFFQSLVHPIGGLTLVLIFMFVLMLLCFLLTRPAGLPPC
ncbi:hypothetical protein PAHAL_9G494500 [Panicum hallii]|uniref:Uncharacterized protein n=1 Tax=Panicum hallii TaxID=206008 RepID=A0A2T8I583_9POAL|nr:hypothetical protein PAHAL_9G494500 [Panicum hallii]